MKHKKAIAKGKVKTDKVDGSLIRCEVKDETGEWIRPESCKTFYISENAQLEPIVFEIKTELPPPFKWTWELKWEAKQSPHAAKKKRGSLKKTFTEKGEKDLDSKSFSVDFDSKIIGGILTVRAIAGNKSFRRVVFVKGKQPIKSDISKYLKSISDADGFEKIIAQESKFKHFYSDDEPVVSFDKGFGLTQLTHPEPSYEECWNWKKNIDAGVKLYKTKVKLAKSYLSQKGRTYTDGQLKLEALARWNGGSYHVWNDVKKQWERNTSLICNPDSNHGWDTRKEKNKDKSLEDLQERDTPFKNKPDKDHVWQYSGACYADHLDIQSN